MALSGHRVAGRKVLSKGNGYLCRITLGHHHHHQVVTLLICTLGQFLPGIPSVHFISYFHIDFMF